MTRAPHTRTRRLARGARAPRRGFTLIELLVTIIIIAIVIAILVPAIGGARDLARATGTRGVMNSIMQASNQFQNDHRRLPGYFSPRAMGHGDNETEGMSAMENILLDLMNGVLGNEGDPDVPAVDPTNGIIRVGPVTSDADTPRAIVDVNLIGSEASGRRSYLTLSGKHLVAQPVGKQVGQPGHTDAEGVAQLPDVVDDFGDPILAWTADDSFVGEIEQADDFAQVDSSDPDPARFYWMSNAAFLKSESLGRKNTSQAYVADQACSLIGDNAPNLEESLMAFLGHPSFPRRDPNSPNAAPTVAAAPRGQLVLHSAGADGYYFGTRDKGARQFRSGQGMQYARNFASESGTIYTDENGNPQPEDITSQFDDILLTGGN